MDANETIEALGAQPMLELLENIGGWNISGKFNISTWSLQNSMHVLQNVYNMGGLFSWAVNEDDRNSSRHIIQVSRNQEHVVCFLCFFFTSKFNIIFIKTTIFLCIYPYNICFYNSL